MLGVTPDLPPTSRTSLNLVRFYNHRQTVTLVEKFAVTASSLRTRALQLVDAVAIFKLSDAKA